MKVLVSSEKKAFETRIRYGEIKILLYPDPPLELGDMVEAEELYGVFEDVRIAIEEYLIGQNIGAKSFIASIED